MRTFNFLVCVICVVTTVLPASATVLVQYNFNEGAGITAADSSGNGRNGTLTADVTWGEGGVVFTQSPTKSARVDWVDGSNAMPLGNSNSFSVAAKIKPEGFVVDEYLFAIGQTIGTCVGLYWNPTLSGNVMQLDRLSINAYASGWQTATISLTSNLIAGQWQDIELRYTEISGTDSRYEIFKNGLLIGSQDNAYQIGSNPDELHIGHIVGGVWYRSYRGVVDDFAITMVPEPVTITLFGLGSLLLARRSRKN